MAIGDRDLHNLPDPGAIGSAAPDLRDWLHRLYDVLVQLRDSVDGLGQHVDHVYSSTDVTQVQGTTTETAFVPAYVPVWAEGGAYRVKAAGVLSTTGEVNLTLYLRYGTTLLLSTPTVTVLPGMGDGVTDGPWAFEAILTCRTTGATGVVMATGTGFVSAGGMACGLANDATVQIDTESGDELVLSAQWGTASVDNIISLQTFNVERLPAPA